jgi:hypothetical protein
VATARSTPFYYVLLAALTVSFDAAAGLLESYCATR